MKVQSLDGRQLPIYTVDFETYYAKDFSLRKYTTTLYVRDPQFKVHGVGICHPDGACTWHPEEGAGEALRAIDWENAAICCHNTTFDGFILSQHYGLFPAMMLDTMSMSRGLRGMNGSHSLKALVAALGIDREMGNKIEGSLESTEGIRDLAQGQLQVLGDYCLQDVRLTRRAFEVMMDYRYPQTELWIIDLVIKAFTDPCLIVDHKLCLEEIDQEQKLTSMLLEKAGASASQLASNKQFAELLAERGIEVPLKPSSTNPDKLTWALGAKDPEFLALGRDHPEIADLIVARKKVKSRIGETRAHTLMAHSRPTLPLMINYGVTQTHRLSGGDKLNCMHPDIEVLTPSGWRRIEDWQPEEGILQWHPDNTTSWVTHPGKVERDDYSRLVWFDSPLVNGGFTEDHRFIGSLRGKWHERTAGWIAEGHKLTGVPTAGAIAQADAPWEDWQLQFLVALAADGTVVEHVQSRSVSFGFRRQPKIDRLRNLLDQSGLPYREVPPDSQGTTHFYLRQVPDWVHKGFGPWLLELSSRQLSLIVDEMVYWDGGRHYRSRQPVFYTSLLDQAQWFATAVHLTGRAARVYSYARPNMSTGFIHHVYVRRTQFTEVNPRRHTTRQDYKGKVYCPSVPSTYVLARHAGQIFVTGQCQNLPSGRAEGQSTRLRNSIQAPPGYKLVVVDSAQIECRTAAAVAGEDRLLEQFRTGADPYSDLATKIFGFPVKKGMKERNVGKAGILACQYGVGENRIYEAVTTGQGGPPMDITRETARKTVLTYRATMTRIVACWHRLEEAILHMSRATDGQLSIGIFRFEQERVLMPNGLYMYYPGLHCTDYERGDWVYKKRDTWVKLYSMKLFEQLVQSTSRTIFLNQTLEVAKRYPKVPFTVHDEAIFLVKEDEADDCLAYALECFSHPPAYFPNLPLEGEGKISQCYTK